MRDLGPFNSRRRQQDVALVGIRAKSRTSVPLVGRSDVTDAISCRFKTCPASKEARLVPKCRPVFTDCIADLRGWMSALAYRASREPRLNEEPVAKATFIASLRSGA
jgi:hypothetical protein